MRLFFERPFLSCTTRNRTRAIFTVCHKTYPDRGRDEDSGHELTNLLFCFGLLNTMKHVVRRQSNVGDGLSLLQNENETRITSFLCNRTSQMTNI